MFMLPGQICLGFRLEMVTGMDREGLSPTETP